MRTRLSNVAVAFSLLMVLSAGVAAADEGQNGCKVGTNACKINGSDGKSRNDTAPETAPKHRQLSSVSTPSRPRCDGVFSSDGKRSGRGQRN